MNVVLKNYDYCHAFQFGKGFFLKNLYFGTRKDRDFSFSAIDIIHKKFIVFLSQHNYFLQIQLKKFLS